MRGERNAPRTQDTEWRQSFRFFKNLSSDSFDFNTLAVRAFELASDEMLSGCQVHRFLVLHKELDADDGELTRTRKVRRNIIAEKFAEDDPYAKAGLFESVSIRPWKKVLPRA